MSTTQMPPVRTCSVDACSFNQSGCHAFAVTIDNTSSCATFIPLTRKGGLPVASAQVGACQRTDCTHNDSLACNATSVLVGSGADTADCLTFEPR
ncbi:hypothetical protein CAPI_08895 [Corynebacterium capitovis DSM 44611]|uniref:DUF1540 domain-containing protein n=1 Tax=Corynebacterium capitovis TaxID=131081 RepID=UPI0003762CFA|nr:DUF1540 domain-containing protein [Corynebacterium capitovis]WKD58305.1 hypothetical protein CAPI_08895 [Corynebacterium capitovis DSM 44611]